MGTGKLSLGAGRLAGVLVAVAAVAYLAAVYLVWDARRLGETAMVEYFRRRALIAAAVVGVLGVVAIFVLPADAPYLFQGLTTRALPLVILSALCGIGALLLLMRKAHRGARVLAIVAVGCAILAWGAAQWPYILPESLTFSAAAAPTGPYIAQAPLAIVVAVADSRMALSDGSRAIQDMLLAAWGEGVGGNWVGFGKLDEVKGLLGIPEELDVLAILPFGYPAQPVGKGDKKRKPLAEIAYRERWGEPYEGDG